MIVKQKIEDVADILPIIDYNKELEELQSFLLEDGLENIEEDILVSRIKRYKEIVIEVKLKYENKCQICGCNFTFLKKNGEYYSEVHHLELLSKGGSQDSSNVVVLCANHHRMFHYAKLEIGEKIGNELKIKLNGIEYKILYK